MGDTPESKPVRVASVNLGGENCFWQYTDGRRHKAVGYLYGPVIGSSFTQNWLGPMNRWYYYLWYPSNHYRPGIGWAVVTLDGKTDLVRCKFTPETSPKP